MNCTKCGSALTETMLFTGVVYDCTACNGTEYGPHADICSAFQEQGECVHFPRR